ncbi:MAG: hypothetical protein SPE89_00965, partial [Fusicatenibacter saccharivorans]|nr:hypothetical protein [Fusicatenibacter saccharivorans]
LQGHTQRVKCNSDLNGEKVWGALRRCPVSRGYTQRVEPPVLRVAATFYAAVSRNSLRMVNVKIQITTQHMIQVVGSQKQTARYLIDGTRNRAKSIFPISSSTLQNSGT